MKNSPTINQTKPTKAQLRRQRYEDKTLKKVCTVRAHPNRHGLIKKFAKIGECPNCKKKSELFETARKMFRKQIEFPKWSDNFTDRDLAISIYTVIFIVATSFINDLINRIPF